MRERFWSKVDKACSGDCWIWTAGVSSDGYGRFSIGRKGDGNEFAHRVAYRFIKGEIPVGLELDHFCRNRACVNPDHLEAVTGRVNTLRGHTVTAANAIKTICANGHPFDAENTGTRKTGGRYCRACNRRACLIRARERRRIAKEHGGTL